MEIKTFYCNPYRECTYIMHNAQCALHDGIIIDPGMYGEKEEKRVLDYLQEQQLTPVAILITHYHPDHICGLECMRTHFPNLSIIDWNTQAMQPDGRFELSTFRFQRISTPGHKEDAVCFYFADEQIIFTGDTLFQESIGRTDLPGGDMTALMHSLNRLKELPEDTHVYPGHGYQTTILHEKQYNPYL